MEYSICPNCMAKVILGPRPKVGTYYDCPDCKTELELIWLDPPELDLFWDYEDDETIIYDDINVD